MNTERDKLIKFVAKLIELTQDKKLIWKAIPPRSSLKNDPESLVDLFYYTTVNDKILGLYKRKEKVISSAAAYADPYSVVASTVATTAALSVTSGTSGYSGFFLNDPKENWTWVTVLEMIDEDANCLWTFPQVSGLNDLYSAVQYHVAGVKELIDSIVGKE